MKGWALWEELTWASRFARRVSPSLARQIAVFCCDQGYNKKTIDSQCGTASLDQWKRDSCEYASV
jgi:hypothetical protein